MLLSKKDIFVCRDLNFDNILNTMKWIQTFCLLCDKAKLIPKGLTFSVQCTILEITVNSFLKYDSTKDISCDGGRGRG